MFETHEEHDNIWKDDDMLEYTADTKYLSSPKNYGESNNKRERVLAEYSKGVWKIEVQVCYNGEWYVSRRESLKNPPGEESEWCWNGKVKSNYGAFTDLSITQRILLSPFYAVWFLWLCISGTNVNIQTLEKSD
jgi:hypothetical protein